MDASIRPLRLRHIPCSALIACLAPAGATFAQAEQAPPPPGANWESYNRSLDGQRYSPLSEINASNAAKLDGDLPGQHCRSRVAAGRPRRHRRLHVRHDADGDASPSIRRTAASSGSTRIDAARTRASR